MAVVADAGTQSIANVSSEMLAKAMPAATPAAAAAAGAMTRRRREAGCGTIAAESAAYCVTTTVVP
jgi:hypothetical protein